MSQDRLDDVTDDDAVIASLPDLQIEVSHAEDMRILQQTDYSGGVDRVAIHRWQVRMLAEEFGLLPAVSNTEADALQQVAKLGRRLRLLHSRIARLDGWLAKQPDYDCADINLEVSFSGCTMDLAEEFLLELQESSSGATRGAMPQHRPAGSAAATAAPAAGPARRAFGIAVRPGESPEQVALDAFRDFVRQNKQLLSLVARWGDDQCGALLQVLVEELLREGPATGRTAIVARPASMEDARALQAQLTFTGSPPQAVGEGSR